jgi:hypothetical protein
VITKAIAKELGIAYKEKRDQDGEKVRNTDFEEKVLAFMNRQDKVNTEQKEFNYLIKNKIDVIENKVDTIEKKADLIEHKVNIL